VEQAIHLQAFHCADQGAGAVPLDEFVRDATERKQKEKQQDHRPGSPAMFSGTEDAHGPPRSCCEFLSGMPNL